MYVLDTNILIHYGNQEPEAKRVIEKWITEGEALATSTIAEAELLSWPHLAPEDIYIANRVLRTVVIFPIDSSTARRAALYCRTYHTPLIDALIAATAFVHNATLITRNTKDFSKIREIEVLKI